MLRKERPRTKNGERTYMDQVKQHTSLHLIPGALALMAMWSNSRKPSYISEFEKGYYKGEGGREKEEKKREK